MAKADIGYALCGSFCTFERALAQLENLVNDGYNVIPIMSANAYSTDTRFGTAEGFTERIKNITGKDIIHTVKAAEPIGPKKMCDLMVVAPCTGNTLAKLAAGITDTAVTMAVKSHLRIQRNVLLCPATNDGLGAAAQNIGRLLNTKRYFFVPMTQDDYENKPNSLVARFELIPECVRLALDGVQPQPVFG